MEVRAHLRYLRTAPRKVRLVVDVVRGLPVDRAVEQLLTMPKQAAEPVRKLIESAVANAEHNFQLKRDQLVIKSIVANEGPRLKRYRPRAFGRAAEILKRMSHVTVVLEDRAASPRPARKTAAKSTEPTMKRTDIKNDPAAPPATPAAAKPAATPTPKLRQRAGTDPEIARKGEA